MIRIFKSKLPKVWNATDTLKKYYKWEYTVALETKNKEKVPRIEEKQKFLEDKLVEITLQIWDLILKICEP